MRLVGSALAVLSLLLGPLNAPREPVSPAAVPPEKLDPADWPTYLGAPAEPIVQVPHSHWILATVTAYTPDDANGKAVPDWLTSILVDCHAHPYGVAADPRALPYGTRIRVPGYMDGRYPGRWWPVDDTGGALRQSWEHGDIHVDVRFKTLYSAQEWGVRRMWIEILDEP